MIPAGNETPRFNVLVIDNHRDSVKDLLRLMAERTIRGTVAGNHDDARAALNQNRWSLVFISREFTDAADRPCHDRLMLNLRQENPELPVILTCDSDTATDALDAIHAGYTEFLTKPFALDKLNGLFDRFCPAHKTQVLACGSADDANIFRIIGKSPALRDTIQLARKAAPTSIPVLIHGESGTGKELIAHLIHDQSRRAQGPFIKLNCAAINDSLLESELFGHEKGAFTGAHRTHKGRFERAHGGTLLLDEITETRPNFQAHLLRVIEEMDLERVGGSENININVRIIATTNKDIRQEVRAGRFRADLYYRLAGIELPIPPLRHRSDDIEDLVWHFVNLYAHETGRKIRSIDPDLLRRFREYTWPGNIRELRNIIRTEMIFGQSPVLSLAHSTLSGRDEPSPSALISDELLRLADLNLEQLEQQAILATLNKTQGNQTQAAKALGISDRTLREKLKKYRGRESLQAGTQTE